MPTIGGVNISWDETQPSDTESAGLGDDRIRSMKTSLRQALDAEHNYPSGGGANTGYHVFGSARPFFGLQSAVSSTGTSARLMLTSDTSRLWEVGMGAVFLGGAGSVMVDGTSYSGWPVTHYWALEAGAQSKADANAGSVTFPNSGFSGIPYMQISIVTTNTQVAWAVVRSVTATAFTWQAYNDTGGSAFASTINWLSLGTRSTGL